MATTAQDLMLHHRHRYTVDDYYRMAYAGILSPDARVELIDGQVMEMPPIGPPHASMVTELQNRLIRAVGDTAVVRVQNPMRTATAAATRSTDSATFPSPDSRAVPLTCGTCADAAPAVTIVFVRAGASSWRPRNRMPRGSPTRS